jgi:plastocyanin
LAASRSSRRRLLACALSLAALAPVAGAAGSSARPATAVGVGEREWRIALYRSHVPVGRVRFNVHNFGEDGHDLAVRNRRGRLLGAMPELDPAANGRLTVRLRRPGRYTVFCSLEGHEARGMRAVLRVR